MNPGSSNEIGSNAGVLSSGAERVLVIMAKAPRPGMVKTRLTPSLPVPDVIAFYRCLLDDTVTLARSMGDVEVAIMCPESDVDELTGEVGNSVRVVAQTGEGLAAGLVSVFGKFAADGRRRVIAFNSDSPHLPASVLESAFEALHAADVVVGPTHDGGYYLVGAKASRPALFEGDRMGTTSALDALLARARGLRLSIAFTEPFYDIDIADDLTRLAADLRSAPSRAPRTASWLEQWERVGAKPPGRAGDL
jgi:rSAM/selenodomain-associated transferase 1